jgi:hypothetical protein
MKNLCNSVLFVLLIFKHQLLTLNFAVYLKVSQRSIVNILFYNTTTLVVI